MHDAFAVIRWSGAGIGAPTASALWSLAVIAEVAVFFVIGPPLIERLSPRGAIALAAAAGMLRWAVMAQSQASPRSRWYSRCTASRSRSSISRACASSRA